MILNTTQIHVGQFSPLLSLGPKIVGGKIAQPREFPYQLSLVTQNGQLFCGASLITTMLALTTVHCVVDGMQPQQIRVVSGERDRQRVEGREQYSDVDHIIAHEGYEKSRSHDNDIGLLVLSKELTIDRATGTILLPDEGTTFQPWAVVSGLGRKRKGGSLSTILKRADVQLMSGGECSRYYWPGTIIEDLMLCATGASGEDTCQGDSGGPLTCKGYDGRAYLCGITSFGQGCGKAPGVYTMVAKYLPWIQSKISILRSQGRCTVSPNRCTLNRVSGSAGSLGCGDRFQCALTGKCIPHSFLCDRDADCGPGDFSDEMNCY